MKVYYCEAARYERSVCDASVDLMRRQVRLQTQSRYKGILDCVSKTYRHEGVCARAGGPYQDEQTRPVEYPHLQLLSFRTKAVSFTLWVLRNEVNPSNNWPFTVEMLSLFILKKIQSFKNEIASSSLLTKLL